MAKTSGGVRTYKNGSSTYLKRQAEVEAMRARGKHSSVEMGKGGGYVAIEKSPAKHKPEELEAARILSDKGYKVTLVDVIKLRMYEMGLTQTKLSELLNVSPSRVSEYLSGKCEPTLKVAREISRKLNIDANIVLGV